MGITKKQKEEICRLYSDMKPISDKQLEWCVKKSAKYIYVDHNNNGWCTRCESKVIMSKTKHLQKVKCPNCSHEMKALHIWRRGYTAIENDSIDWYVFPDVINSHILALRYVVVYKADTEPEYGERARLIMDFEKEKQYTLEKNVWDSTWRYSTMDYFRERGMGYDFRHWCCLPAQIYPYTVNRCTKLDVFKGLKFSPKFFEKFYVNSVLSWSYKRTDLYEKLQKVGMNELIQADLNSYYGHDIKYDENQTSLIKMLGLNKRTFEMLKSCQTIDAHNYLRKYPDISEKDFNNAVLLGFSDKLRELTKDFGMKYGKTLAYIRKNKDSKAKDFVTDYIDYVKTLNELGYPIDNQYCFPKNFRKEDARIQKEYRDREERRMKMTPLEKIEEEARIDKAINKISTELRENKELKQWMKGSSGLKVIVPQSVGELTDEGIRLHNCLATYANKIADKQTLIFFIRKINNPNKEYIAMEYTNGCIRQIRFDNEVPVEDAKILQFADAFARKLTQLDIINQLRRSA